MMIYCVKQRWKNPIRFKHNMKMKFNENDRVKLFTITYDISNKKFTKKRFLYLFFHLHVVRTFSLFYFWQHLRTYCKVEWKINVKSHYLCNQYKSNSSVFSSLWHTTSMYVIELNLVFYIHFETKSPHNTWDNFDDLDAKNIEQSNLRVGNSDDMQHRQRQTKFLWIFCLNLMFMNIIDFL